MDNEKYSIFNPPVKLSERIKEKEEKEEKEEKKEKKENKEKNK